MIAYVTVTPHPWVGSDYIGFSWGANLKIDVSTWANGQSMHIDMIMKTLIHEITHAWSWQSGLFNAFPVNEEVLADVTGIICVKVAPYYSKWKEDIEMAVENNAVLTFTITL